MQTIVRRGDCGAVQGVVLDWAGTAIDYGSFAPTAPFVKVFEQEGVAITMEQARTPMGLMKKDHIRAISRLPEVAVAWESVHHRPCDETDIERMFAAFVPLQMACLADFATPIPGTTEFVRELHEQDIRVGSTTGYVRKMMEFLAPVAANLGYTPDTWVCPSDVPAGRPFPWMCYMNAIRLQVYPMWSIIKIGDTVPDIQEGINAGMWTIGVIVSGNEFGLTPQQVAELSPTDLAVRRAAAAKRLRSAGAHFVADGIWSCMPIIQEIDRRLADGEMP